MFASCKRAQAVLATISAARHDSWPDAQTQDAHDFRPRRGACLDVQALLCGNFYFYT